MRVAMRARHAESDRLRGGIVIAVLGPDAFVLLVVVLEWLDNLGRYLLVAGLAYLVFWVWGRERFRSRLIQRVFPPDTQLWREIRYSLSTSVIFAITGSGIFYAGHAGWLRIYLDVGERGLGYVALSSALLIVLHDTYFYWTHRAMHHPLFYRWMHRVHHQSTNPSPWAAYAFAPAEAVVQAAFVPLCALVIPLHPLALGLFIAFMIVRNVFGHLSIELLPPGFVRHRFWRWHTTTTHHNLHHRRVRGNYGLYFTWWDELMGTTHPDYQRTFDEVATRGAETPRLLGGASPERDLCL
jgi:sterol desaturase/sphingolipid hydroxylase (fatty acid hydroxylase superfamily)